MDIKPSEQIKKHIQNLWNKYLLAEITNDIMLNEISSGLYVKNPDMQWIESLNKQNPLKYGIVSIGFSDTVDDAIENLYNYPEEFLPYSELTNLIGPEEMYEKIMSGIISQTEIYDEKNITDNPYNKHIHIYKKIKNALLLKTHETLPFEFFQSYNNSFNTENPFLHIKTGFFKEKVSYPVLLENNKVWMSIVMSEILSMQKEIEKAHGNVITYGLGLGYYTFMVSEKENVDTVTVVEMNEEVIRLFKEQMLPYFPNKDKIRIIKEDAFTYIKSQEDNMYNFAFADFWKGVEDGVFLYLKLLPSTQKLKNTEFDFWIERCFMEYYFRPVLIKMLYEKAFKKNINIYEPSKSIQKLKKDFEHFIKKQNIIISSEKDVDTLISDAKIKKVIYKFAASINYRHEFKS